MYPFTCTRAVRAAPATTLSRAEEGSRNTRLPEQRQDRGARRSSNKMVFPPARVLPGQLIHPTPSTMLGPRLGKRLHGGMQIFVKTKSLRSPDENQKARQPRGSLPRMPTRPRQDSLPKTPARPRRDSCRGCVGCPGKGLAGGKPIFFLDLLAPLSWLW